MRVPTEEVIEKIKRILKQVYEDDQKYRKNSKDLLDKYGAFSEEMQGIIKDMEALDKINQERIEVILNEYGYLGEKVIGYKENVTIFLVIQHASLDFQLKYYPVMEEAVIMGNARSCDLAMLKDRILVKQGKEQVFGTQLIYDENLKHYILEPLENAQEVDERRRGVGLAPMSEYLEMYGLLWENGSVKVK